MVVVIHGWHFKPTAVITHKSKYFKSICDEHNVNRELVIGKKYEDIYFIPINYFTAEERAYTVCPQCTNDCNELSETLEKFVMDLYNGKISAAQFDNFLKNHQKEIIRKQIESDKNFPTKWVIGIAAVVFIVLLVLRYWFNWF